MPKRNNLNGIPHNLIRSFFGTERYYHKGYMGDWLLNAARKLQIDHALLDVLSGTFTPEALNIRPLVIHAKSLRTIINRELRANGFSDDFIIAARIDFVFPDPVRYRTTIYAYSYLTDCEGREYVSGKIIENGFEPDFDPFDRRNTYPKSAFRVSLEHIMPAPIWSMGLWRRRIISYAKRWIERR
ncbi:MAG TPA: hypothetical protein VK616_02730 [Flavitalea sp.]|nr:hypothetical protein [Flavitalea sp.]